MFCLFCNKQLLGIGCHEMAVPFSVADKLDIIQLYGPFHYKCLSHNGFLNEVLAANYAYSISGISRDVYFKNDYIVASLNRARTSCAIDCVESCSVEFTLRSDKIKLTDNFVQFNLVTNNYLNTISRSQSDFIQRFLLANGRISLLEVIEILELECCYDTSDQIIQNSFYSYIDKYHNEWRDQSSKCLLNECFTFTGNIAAAIYNMYLKLKRIDGIDIMHNVIY